MSYNIDFVITWVDNSDPVWQEIKRETVPEAMTTRRDVAADIRYADNGLLRFWFRGVEKFAPWVNKIFFVTFGHIPDWLNTNNSKLVIVKHEDFLPEEYRPTFNSNTLTLNLHRIPGLSEHFVYFNDDMFLISPCSKEVFFKNGLPCDMAVQDAIPCVEAYEFWYMYFNNIVLLNKNYPKKRTLKQHFFKWFSLKYGKQLLKNCLLSPLSLYTGIFETHTPNAYLKSCYLSEWELNFKQFDTTSKHKIRNYNDVTEWYIRYAQMATGKFTPINKLKVGRYTPIRTATLPDIIASGKYKYICINDEAPGILFNRIESAFHHILPKKSSFEK